MQKFKFNDQSWYWSLPWGYLLGEPLVFYKYFRRIPELSCPVLKSGYIYFIWKIIGILTLQWVYLVKIEDFNIKEFAF